jgi:hypothetical protein
VLDGNVGSDIEEETPKRFMEELNRLASMQPGDTTNRKFAEVPTVRQFACLLSSTSRAALRPARCDMPLPCPKTGHPTPKLDARTRIRPSWISTD